VIERRPSAAWLEVHAENFMTHNTLLAELDAIAPDYPVSLHGVGLSLGSVTLPQREHLNRFRELVTRFEPDLVSDHLSWSAVDGIHLPDLLPLPYTEEALRFVIRNINHVQEVLRRQILLENPSKYIQLPDSAMSEAEFLAEVVLRTGCGVLLDVNNLYVSAVNQDLHAEATLIDFLNAVPPESIGEIHLAGHTSIRTDDGRQIRIDDHGAPIGTEVWKLYEEAIAHLGPLPTLIEWDTRIPAFEILQAEASAAESIIFGLSDQEGRRAAIG
jgi:uncharacterized protein (UPF0276 family)